MPPIGPHLGNFQTPNLGIFRVPITPAAGATPATGNDVLTATFTPSDTTTYTSASQSVVLTVNKAVPTITWSQPAPITFGTQLTATQLNATTTVSGTMTYSLTLDSIPPTGVDQLTATFTPNDYTDYAVVSKTVNLTVSKATPVITWLPPAAITFGTALTSAQLNADASVQGTFVYNPAVGTVPVAGTNTLTATFTPTDTTNYNTTTASVSISVNKATPAMTWPTPSAITYGTALSATQLNASAGSIAGSFVYSPALGAVLNAGTQTLSAIFTPTSTNYATVTISVSLMVNKAASSLTWATPSAITYGTALSATQLNASAGSIAGSFAYSPALGAVLNAGTQSLSVTFTPTSANYATGTSTVSLLVNKATPSLTFASIPAQVLGVAPFSVNATSASSGAITYSITSGPATIAGGTVSVTGVGTVIVLASQAATANYSAAMVSASFVVSAAPAITLLSLPEGPVAMGVVITGTNFGSTQGNSSVSFNGTTATSIIKWRSNSITVQVPSGAATGNVVVKVGGVSSTGGPSFQVDPPFSCTTTP